MFPPASLPGKGDLVLVTDELFAPADFLLHQLFTSHFKTAGKNAKCIILTVSENANKWNTIAAKSNSNLPQLLNSQDLTFLDIVPPFIPSKLDENARGTLRPAYEELQDHLGDAEAQLTPTLVILDDISSLQWIGVPTQDLLRFARAIAALCRKHKASLIIRHHVVTPGEPDDIFRLLAQICTCHIDVSSLSSGRSGTVSGQIALHPGAGQLLKICPSIPRRSALQYKLTDSNCVYFERGTSSGVL